MTRGVRVCALLGSVLAFCAVLLFTRYGAHPIRVAYGNPDHERPDDGARLQVAVVIDASGSMKKQDPRLLSKVAAKLFVELAGPRDEVGIVEFGTTARLIDRAFVTGPQARRRLFDAIDKVGRAAECTDYLAGLKTALAMFKGKKKADERRLIIFLTDGTYDPNRANESYYALLSAAEKQKLWSKRVQKLWTKVKADEKFKARPCRRRYDPLKPAARKGFAKKFTDFLQKDLKPSKVRVFAIGFGTALAGSKRGGGGEEIKESLALLKKLAQTSRGRTLIEHDVTKIPRFFAEIFAALVGAPVEGFPRPKNRPQESYTFEVVQGTRSLAVVIPADGDAKFAVALRRGGKKQTEDKAKEKHAALKLHRQTRHNEIGHERRNKGQVLAGYRFLTLSKPRPGQYTVYATAGRKKRFSAQIIKDVGLQLSWLEPKPKPLYAEKKAGRLKFRFALRTALGAKVTGLSQKFMRDMRFYWQLRRKTDNKVIASAHPKFDPAHPMKPLKLSVDRAKLPEGKYLVEVWADHAKGFFELRRLAHPFRVLKYIKMDVSWKSHPFTAKSKEKFAVRPWVALSLANDIKAPQKFKLDLSGVPNRDKVVLFLHNTTSGCKVAKKIIPADQDAVTVCLFEKKGRVTLDLRLRNHEKARSQNLEFDGKIVLSPVNPDIFKGKKHFETQTRGRIVAWTFWDWVRYYRNWIIGGAVLLFLLLWIVGRKLAGAFPPKATLYYKDLEEGYDEPSQFALGRRVKSHLPFVSACHIIGGKGMPRSARELCKIKATAGGGFEILPQTTVTFERDDLAEEKRKPFRGRFEEHYTVGERYEIWLTRRPEY